MVYSYLPFQSHPVWPPAWPLGRRRWAGWSPRKQNLVRADRSLVRKERNSGRRSWGRRNRKRSSLPVRHQGHPAAEAVGTSWHEMDRWPRRPDHRWHHRRRLLLLQLEDEKQERFKGLIWVNSHKKPYWINSTERSRHNASWGSIF